MKAIKKITVLMFTFATLACNANSGKNISETTPKETLTETGQQYIKVALLLDTSNSMDGLIDQTKAQLWEIVNELSHAKCQNERPNLQIALYEYGNDGLSEAKGYLRKVISFTDDLDTVSEKLFSLTTNGGSEYCGTVIKASTNELDWGTNPDDLKMVFIAGNEPFTQGKTYFKDAIADAKEKDIVVNTIFCGDYNHGVRSSWKEGAILGKGEYMAIDHNQHTVHIASPYDDIILQLNVKLNATYVPYGRGGRKRVQLQKEQDKNAQGYGKANAVSRTISKSSHLYKNTSWDLVDAEAEEDFSYEKIEEEDLPESLRGKSMSELKAYIEKMKQERNQIKEEIALYNKKRKAYIDTTKEKATNPLESVMLKAIKRQAKEKNYTWN